MTEPFDVGGNPICRKCRQKLLDLEIFGLVEHVCPDEPQEDKEIHAIGNMQIREATRDETKPKTLSEELKDLLYGALKE